MNIPRINNKYLFIAVFAIILIIRGVDVAAREDQNRQAENPFGVLAFLQWDHTWNSFKYPSRQELEKAAQLMNEAGIGMARFDFLWEDIEPAQGRFDFEKYDLIVEVLSRHNIKILGILNYSTSWAAACPDWNCVPKDNELFVNYAVRVIGRYKDRVKHWEVWNEPDSSTYWSQQDGLKSYCALLKEVYQAAKLADPDCKILNGGLALGLSSVNRLYDNGAKEYFDILNIHFFENPLYPNRVKAVTAYPKLARKVMLRNGDADKEIWITEIGCPGVKKGLAVADWWMGTNPNEKEQAVWLKEVYAALIKERVVAKIFWAFLRDCDSHWGNGVDYFGLLRWDFSPKPAFFAYKETFEDWKKSLSSAVK